MGGAQTKKIEEECWYRWVLDEKSGGDVYKYLETGIRAMVIHCGEEVF